MIKGERTLRSASPHRNAYKADFHAIKCSFDGTKSDAGSKSSANGSSGELREDIARGRNFGNRVHKIKNIFLQMDSQQQESQDGKAIVNAPQISPPPKFPVSGTSKTSPNVLDPQSDRTPKGEDAEIDKAALAEKFSVTRKLFERGMKDQTTVEKQAPGRASGRLSQGSVCEERRASRKPVGSAENGGNNSIVKRDRSSASPESKDAENSKQVNRLLNAGPISRRLENFMADSDNEESARTSAKTPEKVDSPTERSGPVSPLQNATHKPTSPLNDHFQYPTSPSNHSKPVYSPTSPTSDLATKSISSVTQEPSKPTSPTTKGSDETCVPASRHPSSSAEGFKKSCTDSEETKPIGDSPRDQKSSAFISSFCNRVKGPEAAKRESITLRSSSGDTIPPHSQQTLDPTRARVVRAELVRVQNESSESEENEEDCVFEELKLKRELSPDILKGGLIREALIPSSQDDLHKVTEVKKQETEDSLLLEGQLEGQRAKLAKQESDKQSDDEEEMEEDSEQDDEDECGKTSPVFYSFENAAFVDDKETGPVQMEEDEEEEAEDDQDYEEYDEIIGLSEEEECSLRRKVCFSSAPIRVCENDFIVNLTKHLGESFTFTFSCFCSHYCFAGSWL